MDTQNPTLPPTFASPTVTVTPDVLNTMSPTAFSQHNMQGGDNSTEQSSSATLPLSNVPPLVTSAQSSGVENREESISIDTTKAIYTHTPGDPTPTVESEANTLQPDPLSTELENIFSNLPTEQPFVDILPSTKVLLVFNANCFAFLR